MPDWFNDFSDIPIILAIMTTFFAAVTYVIKREVTTVKHEVFPNSGTSLRDAIDRIEKKLDTHIEWHMDHRESR
jgi:hypothetical protein